MTGQTADPEICRCTHTAVAHEDPEDESGEVHLGSCKADLCGCQGFWSEMPLPKLERCLEPVKRPPGRPRKPPIEVPAEQLPQYTALARELLSDEKKLFEWASERRMVAIVALGETLADPKLFLEVTDDLLAGVKDATGEQGKKRGKR